VQDQYGHTSRCRIASCTIRGLENGTTYKFHVRAHNAVGFSAWSGYSSAYMPDDPLEIVGKIKLLKAGDGYLHIDWNPVESKGGSEISYFIKWQGGQATSYTSDLEVSGLDNHKTYTFTIQPRNGFIPGGFLTSAPFQPIGPAGQPRAPTVTDQETPGSAGAVTLSWDPVDPNGPGGVRYTVFRDGAPLTSCTKIAQTGCDVTGLAYDGHTYVFTVQAVNKDGRPGGQPSAMSPQTAWKAVGKPASWGAWSVRATGNNNQASASFTVPASRGELSRVNVYADGAKVQQTTATGDVTLDFNVADNLGPHTVMLELCNEKNACSQSSTQNVQTWGPLVQGNIHSITPTIDATRISWTIEVDSNGSAASVTVTSDRGRSEQFAVPVGVSSFTTQPIDLGYRETENVTVTLSDPDPARGPVTATNGATTDPPPPPVVVASKGAACNDDPAAGLRPCNLSGQGGQNCTDASCAFVHIALSNWDVAGALVFCSVNGAPGQPFDPYADTDSNRYYGTPGGTVTVHCENAIGQQADTTLTW
jgi:large repetitive protein